MEKCLWGTQHPQPSSITMETRLQGNTLGFSIETDWHLGTTTDGSLRFLQRQTWPLGRPGFTLCTPGDREGPCGGWIQRWQHPPRCQGEKAPS